MLDFPFTLDSGQDPEPDLVKAMEFTGKYGSIPGKFTCDGATAADCVLVTSEDKATGETVITASGSLGWEFVSNDNVESESVQDEDYMYFGYWLQTPGGTQQVRCILQR